MGLDTVELVLAVEEHFAIEISDVDSVTLATCGALSDYVERQLRARGDLRPAEVVWTETKQIIVEQLGVKPDEVTRAARFYEDLGAG